MFLRHFFFPPLLFLHSTLLYLYSTLSLSLSSLCLSPSLSTPRSIFSSLLSLYLFSSIKKSCSSLQSLFLSLSTFSSLFFSLSAFPFICILSEKRGAKKRDNTNTIQYKNTCTLRKGGKKLHCAAAHTPSVWFFLLRLRSVFLFLRGGERGRHTVL